MTAATPGPDGPDEPRRADPTGEPAAPAGRHLDDGEVPPAALAFSRLVRQRRMCRSYRTDPVPAEVLDRVLDATRRAPSAGNSQGWAFVVLEGPANTARLWDVSFPAARRSGFAFPGLFDAPVLIVPLAHPEAYVDRYGEPDKARTGLGGGAERWAVPYWLVDTAFATMNLQLAATAEGLGTLFFGLFDHGPAVLEALGVPAGYEPLGAVALGWPAAVEARAGRSSTRRRRALDEVVHRNGW